MPLERLSLHEDEPDPQRSRDTAVAVPAPADRWDADQLLRLSGTAGNQAVARLLHGPRRIQRTLNKGAAGSTTAANAVLEPTVSSPLQAGPMYVMSAALGDSTKQWVQAFCKANGNTNRFSESFEVGFGAGNVKIKGENRKKLEGTAQMVIEIDFRGANHGGVDTPHFKVWSKFDADKSLTGPWPGKVFPLSDAQVRTILTSNTLASLTSTWTGNLQKYYTFKNYGESFVP